MKIRRLGLVGLVIMGTSVLTALQEEKTADKVMFEVVPLKTVYRPNEPITLRLILTNHGEAPVMVERFSEWCSSDFFAFVSLSVIDARNREAQKAGCAADSFLSKEAVEREAAEVGKKDYWIKLKKGNLFGAETIREVKTQPGTYTLRALYLPARFPQEERTRIAQAGITILSGRIEAPAVQITIR